MVTKKPAMNLDSYMHKWYVLQALARDLASRDIESRIKARYPETDPGQILRAMREQHAKLEEVLEQELPPIWGMREMVFEKLEARPFVVRRETPVAFDSSFLTRLLEKLTPECPDLSIGQVKASGFNHYQFRNAHENSSKEFMAFWPYGQYPNQLPTSSFSGDWSGELGAWFVGWLKVYPASLWPDPYDYISHGGVLQFTIPAPQCDSIVYWGIRGHAVAWNWVVTADPGHADAWWLLHESPDGADFPQNLDAFESNGSVLWKWNPDTGDTTTYDGAEWNRSFRVKAGVASRIYLGMGLTFWGRNGTISAPGLASYFKFDYGITYLMAPDIYYFDQPIDAALYSGSKCYFFHGNRYIRVTRGDTGPGTVDPGYPKPISNWGWGSFGANGIDAALYSGSKCYFFSGNQYIRVTRGDTGPGTVDPGYPAPMSNWLWPSF